MDAKFKLGSVITTSFRIWRRNFASVVVLTVLIYLPVFPWAFLIAETDWRVQESPAMDFWVHDPLFTFLSLNLCAVPLLGIVVPALISHGVVMDLQGRRLPFGPYLARGFARPVPALGALFVMVLCIAGTTICVVFLLSFVGRANQSPSVAAAIPIVGGVLMGLYAWSTLYIAVPAAVMERPGVLGALRRSWVLTRGHRLAIGVLQVLPLAIHCVIPFVRPVMSRRSLVYFDLGRSVLLGSFIATMAAVVYHRLRVEKDPGGAEIATVFD